MTLSIPDFSKTRVVVAGDVMLDQYLFGATSRISPEAPVPVVHVQKTDDRPGGAANVAVNLASLGVSTQLIGAVGNDAAADTLERLLTAYGIDCDFARVGDRPTITKTRVQSRGRAQDQRADGRGRHGRGGRRGRSALGLRQGRVGGRAQNDRAVP